MKAVILAAGEGMQCIPLTLTRSKFMVKRKYIDSGRRKLGVIMGDDVHTAINTCINVGTVMENGRATKLGKVVR